MFLSKLLTHRLVMGIIESYTKDGYSLVSFNLDVKDIDSYTTISFIRSTDNKHLIIVFDLVTGLPSLKDFSVKESIRYEDNRKLLMDIRKEYESKLTPEFIKYLDSWIK